MRIIKIISYFNCRTCSRRTRRTKTNNFYFYKNKRRSVFIGKNGKRILDKQCGKCRNEKAIERKHKRGINKPIDQVIEPMTKKGRHAEVFVSNYLKRLGYIVQLNNKVYGPDIILQDPINSQKWRVEVKSIRKAINSNSYQISKVRPNRLKDHFIAFPLPSKEVFMEPMKNHLLKCTKSGNRTITKLILNDLRNN